MSLCVCKRVREGEPEAEGRRGRSQKRDQKPQWCNSYREQLVLNKRWGGGYCVVAMVLSQYLVQDLQNYLKNIVLKNMSTINLHWLPFVFGWCGCETGAAFQSDHHLKNLYFVFCLQILFLTVQYCNKPHDSTDIYHTIHCCFPCLHISGMLELHVPHLSLSQLHVKEGQSYRKIRWITEHLNCDSKYFVLVVLRTLPCL